MKEIFSGVLVTLLLASCSGPGPGTDGAATRVGAAFYPWAYIVERVGGSAVEVDNLTSPGAEPHDLELAPQRLADLIDADLVVYETGFQPAVDDGLAGQGQDDQRRLDVADLVELRRDPEGEGVDPHVWLDPTNMITVTEAVVGQLSDIDPTHAGEFRANGDRLIADLRALDADFRAGLADCARATIVTGHAAFGYLADRYGLTQIPIAGVDPSMEPDPADQAAITDLVRRDGVTTIFSESLLSPAIAQSIADETGAEVDTLDPIEGLSDDSADETYLTLMRANLAAIEEADDCS